MAMAELYRTMMGTPGGPGAPAHTHGGRGDAPERGQAPPPISLSSSGRTQVQNPGQGLRNPSTRRTPEERVLASPAGPDLLHQVTRSPCLPGEVCGVMPQRPPLHSL